MPVTRAQINISPQIGTNAVTARPGNAGAALSASARQMGQLANQYGQMMAGVAQERGQALVRSAVFSTGPNGMPQMPPNAAEQMGEIARRTYDEGMIESMASRMTSAMRAQITEAENANQYDYDAFQEDAAARLDAMSQDVPEQFGGMFQQIAQGLIVDAGGTIGRRQANFALDQERRAVPGDIQMFSDNIRMHVRAGDMDSAQAVMISSFDMINSRPDIVSDPAAKEAARNELTSEANFGRMVNDLGLAEEGTSPLAIKQIQERLRTLDVNGSDDELLKYTLGWQQNAAGDWVQKTVPSGEIAQGIASRLDVLLSDAYESERIGVERTKAAAATQDVLRGHTTVSTNAQRDILDGILAAQNGLDGISPETWLGGVDDQTLNRMVRQTKTSGGWSTSLTQTFNRLENVTDKEELTQGFSLWKKLKDIGNTGDQARDLTADVPERLSVMYNMADNLGGDVSTAMDKIDAAYLNAPEYGPDRLLDDISDWYNDNRGLGDDYLTEENAPAKMRKIVNEYVFKDIDAADAEKAEAQSSFKLLLMMGERTEDALEIVRQNMDGRYINSEYMPNSQRTNVAPEQYFPDPPIKGAWGLWSHLSKTVDAKILDTLEGLIGRMIWPSSELPANLAIDLGADRRGASRFDIMADTEIRNMINEMPEERQKAFFASANLGFTERDMFTPGTDVGQYWLIPKTTSGGSPTYNVVMRGEGGDKIPLGVLDINKQWQKMLDAENYVKEIDRRLSSLNRSLDFLSQNTPEADQAWMEVTKKIMQSNDPNYIETMALMRELSALKAKQGWYANE